MNKKSIAAYTLFVFLATPSARAGILVDHQPHPYGGLGSDTLWADAFGQPVWQRVADDFTLGSADQAVSLIFWGFYNADNPPATETMRIRVYAGRASDGLPDDIAILSETTVQNPSRVATGRRILTGIGPHEYRYQADLGSPLSLEARTRYWLEVAQMGDITTNFRWEDSVNALDGVATVNSIHAEWRATFPGGPADAAFQLISPEPASIAILTFGSLFLARRRRGRREANEWK